MSQREAKSEAQRMQINREELIYRMAQVLPVDGSLEAFTGFFLARSSKPTESVQSVYQPAFCFVAQGGKRHRQASQQP
jgi:AraC-type transcriptional regulator N-terminus